MFTFEHCLTMRQRILCSLPHGQWRRQEFVCSCWGTRVGRFGHVARLPYILFVQIGSSESAPRRGMASGHHRSGECLWPTIDHLPWTHQICRDTGVTVTKALQLAAVLELT